MWRKIKPQLKSNLKLINFLSTLVFIYIYIYIYLYLCVCVCDDDDDDDDLVWDQRLRKIKFLVLYTRPH